MKFAVGHDACKFSSTGNQRAKGIADGRAALRSTGAFSGDRPAAAGAGDVRRRSGRPRQPLVIRDDGETCNEDICEGVTEICESDDNCAGDTSCCEDGGCDADCCADSVSQVPDTGVGQSGKASTGVFAAAALLAGKKLREADAEAEPNR